MVVNSYNLAEKHVENGVTTINGYFGFETTVKPEDEYRYLKWNEKTSSQKTLVVLKNILKLIGILGCLYFFICSLDLMSSAFRLVGGRYAASVFQDSKIFNNPLAGLVIGIVVTVVVQSSSTSTSIVVSMVASGILKVKMAIPIIMGANIGTSVTSTFVSLGQLGNKDEFRRAFAAATVHDMFNWLSVLVLLPLEVITGYLEKVSDAIVGAVINEKFNVKEPEMLNAITKPFTSLIVQLDKRVLDSIANGTAAANATLLKHICKTTKYSNGTIKSVQKCEFLFESLNWAEWGVGLLLLFITLIVLCCCLVLLVKILNSIFKGPVAKLLQKVVNSDFPGPFKHLTGYFAIFVGCGLTIIVQSSSVFTSTLTPLVGLGIVTIERMYPLALGSNIGTTITGILAALTQDAKSLPFALQIALCHTLFNITGILIWFPIPFLRKAPLKMASVLGDTSAEYRWFTLIYILFAFVIGPLAIFGLSLAGIVYLAVVLIPIALLVIFILIVNLLQDKRPNVLPRKLRDWNFLPEYLRSLKPYDKFLLKYVCFCNKFKVASNNVQPATTGDGDDREKTNVVDFNENNHQSTVRSETYLNNAFSLE